MQSVRYLVIVPCLIQTRLSIRFFDESNSMIFRKIDEWKALK